jgi:hypothetical protein
MTDAKTMDMSLDCLGCGSQNRRKKTMPLYRCFFLLDHPEMPVEVEKCMDCGTVTYKITAYYTIYP